LKNNSTLSKDSKNLIAYFIIAYAISWSIVIPLALSKQGIIPPILPPWAHYFAAYGPMLSAFIVTWISQGRPGLSELGKRMIKWKIPPIWWITAFSPLIIGLVVVLVLNLINDSKINLSTLGEVNFLPPLGIGALVLWILTFGIGEETGWRGYALPRLQRARTALSATIILAVFWALWHLPQFFFLFDPAIAIGWVIGLFAGAIVLTWLFNSSSGSILIVAIWHGCFNFLTSTNAGNGILAAVVSAAIMVWAVVVVVLFKPKDLSNQAREIA
jgi:membrane protease YdiL (CAAX protease family)